MQIFGNTYNKDCLISITDLDGNPDTIIDYEDLVIRELVVDEYGTQYAVGDYSGEIIIANDTLETYFDTIYQQYFSDAFLGISDSNGVFKDFISISSIAPDYGEDIVVLDTSTIYISGQVVRDNNIIASDVFVEDSMVISSLWCDVFTSKFLLKDEGIISTSLSNTDQIINPNRQLINITDVLGRESKPTPNVPLFYRYNDGTVEKRIIVE
ncbi:MAG: hypothetical protein HON40_04655 [Flavobacteriales bacterium]|nr:hypothetical protein [Flavobacteriales bacterium]